MGGGDLVIAVAACACVALACWAFVALDLGRKAIALTAATEERRRADAAALDFASLSKRLERLEKDERDMAAVLRGRR